MPPGWQIAPDKRACIEWSGQLPGGRRPGSYFVHPPADRVVPDPCKNRGLIQPGNMTGTVFIILLNCLRSAVRLASARLPKNPKHYLSGDFHALCLMLTALRSHVEGTGCFRALSPLPMAPMPWPQPSKTRHISLTANSFRINICKNSRKC